MCVQPPRLDLGSRVYPVPLPHLVLLVWEMPAMAGASQKTEVSFLEVLTTGRREGVLPG